METSLADTPLPVKHFGLAVTLAETARKSERVLRVALNPDADTIGHAVSEAQRISVYGFWEGRILYPGHRVVAIELVEREE